MCRHCRFMRIVCGAFALALAAGCVTEETSRGNSFVLAGQDTSGRFYGFIHTTWIAVSALALAGAKQQATVKAGLAFLRSQSFGRWADSQLGWALDCLAHAGMPRTEPLIANLLGELLSRAPVDGHWASEDGPEYAISATIELLKVLDHFGWEAGGVPQENQ